MLTSVPPVYAMLPINMFDSSSQIPAAAMNVKPEESMSSGMRKMLDLKKKWISGNKLAFLE
jgi:hypothetical protein